MPSLIALASYPYPDLLQASAWKKHEDKNKATAASTNLAFELKKLQEAFGQTLFSESHQFEGIDTAEYLLFKKKLDEGITKGYANLKPKLKSALKEAEATAKVIPAAKDLAKALEAMDDTLSRPSREVLAELDRSFQHNLQDATVYKYLTDSSRAASGVISEIAHKMNQIVSDPTLATFHKVFGGDGSHRLLPTLFKGWDQLVKAHFPTLSASVYRGSAMHDYGKLPHILAVANETSEHASKIIREQLAHAPDEASAVKQFLREYHASLTSAKPMLAHFGKLQAMVDLR